MDTNQSCAACEGKKRVSGFIAGPNGRPRLTKSAPTHSAPVLVKSARSNGAGWPWGERIAKCVLLTRNRPMLQRGA